MTATFTKSIRKHIFLHPADRQRRWNAIKKTLLKDKKKHSDRLGGALLDVSNLKVIGDRHLIVDGYLSMEVLADCLVFAPTTNMQLEGAINKLSKSHVGCLVMDTFNAVLSIPDGSSLDPQIGDGCQFTVTEVIVDDEILFIRGCLQSVHQNSNIASSFQQDEPKFEVFSEEELGTTLNSSQKSGEINASVDALDSSVFGDGSPKKRKRKVEKSCDESSHSPAKKKSKRKSS